MKLHTILRSLLLGIFSGPVIAWFVAGVFYYYPVQQAAIVRGEIEEFAIWPLLLIGGVGALIGASLAIIAGNRPLPSRVKYAAIGALIGTAVVVFVTLVAAQAFGGPSSIGQAPYLDMGRIYGVPAAVVLGSVIGILVGYRVGRLKRPQRNNEQSSIEHTSFLGSWGLYPWFEEHGRELVHPEDIQALRLLMPYGKVFQCVAIDEPFITIRYGSQCFRVASKLFRPISHPKKQFGDKVCFKKGSSVETGQICDIFWHSKNSRPFYFVRINGKKLSKRYWDEDFLNE